MKYYKFFKKTMLLMCLFIMVGGAYWYQESWLNAIRNNWHHVFKAKGDQDILVDHQKVMVPIVITHEPTHEQISWIKRNIAECHDELDRWAHQVQVNAKLRYDYLQSLDRIENVLSQQTDSSHDDQSVHGLGQWVSWRAMSNDEESVSTSTELSNIKVEQDVFNLKMLATSFNLKDFKHLKNHLLHILKASNQEALIQMVENIKPLPKMNLEDQYISCLIQQESIDV